VEKWQKTVVGTAMLCLAGSVWLHACRPPAEALFLSYRVDPQKAELKLYWKDDHNQPLRSLARLKRWLRERGKALVFATNGGMYQPGNYPVGLFIDAGRVVVPLDTAAGKGNFYLKPNGVFYLTAAKQAVISPAHRFVLHPRIRYATQSGPLLVIDGRIHSAFKPGSANVNVRNGVGILPDGQVLFVMSKQPVNFYDFARYFQQQGCRQALYLDGFVSRTYLPEQRWVQTDGDFGVLVGVTER
jgi:uncharacterized protein YigE (DUF2233 family)